MSGGGRWRIGLGLAFAATVVRVAWALAVPTIPVGDFATYRESAIYLAEFGHLDRGFVYMPGWVWLLSLIHQLGGEVRASKLVGAVVGGLAAGPLFAVTARLMDNGWAGRGGQSPPPGSPIGAIGAPVGRGRGPVAVGVAAAVAYTLWPAGLALASVVGTDIPTAAVLVLALALLCGWGDTRPWLAAAAFGGAMGVAAYLRAVALPLTVLSGVYWVLRGVRLKTAVLRTALAVAMTILFLLPWGVRNWRHEGELYLTDSHGGITALMGNYPNSEGTHSRSLGTLFQQLTGRTLLMEPHRQTDHAAYALARQWIGFDPAWTIGMIALRIERLFALEHGLLYWSLYRPGVLPPAAAGWFNLHRPFVTGMADLFYWLFAGGLVVGVGAAWGERRWMMLLPLPFAGALALTYALFVAEPRYRLSTEVLLFPLVGLGLVRVGALGRHCVAAAAGLFGRAVRQFARARAVGAGGALPMTRGFATADRRTAVATLIVAAAVVLGGLAVVRGGALLRERHRWAVTAWQVAGWPRLAMWGTAAGDEGPSPVRGGSPGAWLTVSPPRTSVLARIVLPDVVLPSGRVWLAARLSWEGERPDGLRLSVGRAGTAGAVDPSSATERQAWAHFLAPDSASVGRGGVVTAVVRGTFEHSGGPVRLWARLARSTGGNGASSVLVSDVSLDPVGESGETVPTPTPQSPRAPSAPPPSGEGTGP